MRKKMKLRIERKTDRYKINKKQIEEFYKRSDKLKLKKNENTRMKNYRLEKKRKIKENEKFDWKQLRKKQIERKL